MASAITITTRLAPGYQVASGLNKDPKFKGGTIALQKPFFSEVGICLDRYFNGTLNLDISPYTFAIVKPDHQINQLLWSEDLPAENFSLVECRLNFAGNEYPALIYYPNAQTKVEHFQAHNIVEVLSPFIEGVSYGDVIGLTLADNKVKFKKS